MKLIYFITRIDEIGGAQVHVRDMALAMACKKHTVKVVSGVGGDLQYINELKNNGIDLCVVKSLAREIKLFNDLFALIKIVKILKAEKPDLLSLHSSKAGFLGRLAAKITGTPVLFTAHGFSFAEGVPHLKARFYACAERLAAYLCPKIINVSDHDKRLALKYKIAPVKKFQVIHNGMSAISRELLAKPEKNACRLVMTARFAPPKNHRLLLNALKHYEKQPWIMDFIGTGRLEKEIKIFAEKYNLSDRIVFHGQTHKVAEILGKAQIFILITNWEGLPRSIIEALRAGLPVIASNVGGIPELVEHEINGYLVPRGDKNSLIMYLGKLLNDPQLRKRMGKASKIKYESGFTFKNMFKETYTLYQELIN